MSSNDHRIVVQAASLPEQQFSSLPMDYGNGPAGMYLGRSLREYLHILLKHKWLIIGTFLVITLAGALYTYTRTPIFRTSATLQITQDNPGSQLTTDSKLSTFISDDNVEKFQQTQYEILKSRSLALRVIKALNLADHPDFKPIKENSSTQTKSEIEDAMVGLFLGKLEITPVKNSYLVEVSFQSPDNSLTQRVVNAFADEYMYLSIDQRNASFSLVRKWLDKQLQEMTAKVQETQKKLYKFGQKTDIYTMEDKDNVVVQKFIDLSGLLTKAEADNLSKEAQYQQIKVKGPDAPLIVNNPMVAQLRSQVVIQQAKVSALRKVYRGGNPDLQVELANLAELKSRLQAEIQRLRKSVKADYEASARTEKLLRESFAAQKEQMAKLQDNLANFQIMKRDAQTNEQLYQALLARVKEASVASTMVASNVTVIDPGQLPTSPFKPNNRRNVNLAMLLGLTLGVGLAILVESLDDSIKSLDDLERYCHMPSLGVLPVWTTNGKISLDRGKKSKKSMEPGSLLPGHWPDSKSAPESELVEMVLCRDPESLFSESIRQAHTSIMLSAPGRPPCALIVTSPNPSEGKSMLAANLALSFALDRRPTVLMDCDLRRPRLHQILQLDSQPGLTNFLTGGVALEEIIRSTAFPNLMVITSGPRSPSPGILLNSESFKELLTRLRQQFRHIVIDTPPILAFADGRMISPLADGVLMVTKYNSTTKGAGLLSQQLLSKINAPILGAVMNCVDKHAQSYGGYYYNYHHKYYSYYRENKVD